MKRLLSIALTILIGAFIYFILPESCPEAAKRTAFVFVVAAAFWAFEIIPLYATSLVVVLLEILLLGKPDGVLGMDKSGYTVFLVPFSSPVIMLFFGGFILATAMQKYHVDRLVAGRLLHVFGEKPFCIMLGFMITTAFLSMWLSNTATTAMMIAMIMPLLAGMDADDAFKKALAIAIAFSANIGGIATPVGTPPNAIALGILAEHGIYLTFLSWMKMAVPLALLLLLLTAGILFIVFRPKHAMLDLKIEGVSSLSLNGKIAVVIALGTVVFWLTSGWHQIPEAVVALLAAGFYTASGLLDRNDLKKIDWDILVLMWGGLALGKGMQVSGLADWILNWHVFSHPGLVLVAAFCIAGALLSMFISNTATANLIIPLAVSIPGENPIILAIVIALSCSVGMALPISTPPNAMAFSTNAFSSRDMFKAGILVCAISLIVMLIGFEYVLGGLVPKL